MGKVALSIDVEDWNPVPSGRAHFTHWRGLQQDKPTVRGVVVGSGSVVIGDVPAARVVAGVPAKETKYFAEGGRPVGTPAKGTST